MCKALEFGIRKCNCKRLCCGERLGYQIRTAVSYHDWQNLPMIAELKPDILRLIYFYLMEYYTPTHRLKKNRRRREFKG